MSETIIRSSRNDGRDITIAKAADSVVISKSAGNHPAKFMVIIPIEDFPAVFKAFQQCMHEIQERESL